MKKKSIVFLDWNGTLCWSRFWESLRSEGSPEYAWGQKIEQLLFAKNQTLINDWMRGSISSEQVNAFLSQKLDVNPERLWKIFVKNCEQMKFDDQLRRQIKQLKKYSYVVLATDNMDCFSRFTVPALGLEKIFDRILNSFDLGYHKTENNGETFLMCSRLFNVPLKNAFLVDDSVKSCKYFNALGGKSYLVQDDIIDTRHFLKEISRQLSE